VRAVLVVLGRPATAEDIAATMAAKGLRPAKLDECLAYGEYQLGINHKRPKDDASSHWVSCLGQSALVVGTGWFNKGTATRKVPEMFISYDNIRYLKLESLGGRWDNLDNKRFFLAVRD
jgi:hypothetical protein